MSSAQRNTVPCQESLTGKQVFKVNKVNVFNSSMPTQHKTSRHELTPVERAYLVGRHDAGKNFDQISHKTGILKTTIVDTIHNAKERGNTNSLSCASPCKTDARTDRRLCCDIRKNQKTR